MIVILNGEVARASLAISRPLEDGTPGPAEPFEAAVVTLGLGAAGSLQVALPIDLAETIGQGMVDAAQMTVIPVSLDDAPEDLRG